MSNDICEVDGCDRPRYAAKAICEPHYRRLLRTGSVNADVAIGEHRSRQACSADECSREATERGLCHGHYLRVIRSGDVQTERPLSRRVNNVCAVDGCDREATRRQLCRTHANRKRKYGDVQAAKPIREVAGDGFLSHGYRLVPVPEHLRHLTNGVTPYAEHRLVMATLLGRSLTSEESVHHVNGDRSDNRVEGPLRNFRSGNLELWSGSQPSGQRVLDKVAWAIETLERYAPSALAVQMPLFPEASTGGTGKLK